MVCRWAGGPRARAGTRAGRGRSGAPGGAAAAAPGRRGRRPRRSRGAGAPCARAPRERGARRGPGAAPPEARGTRTAASACTTPPSCRWSLAPGPRPRPPQAPPAPGPHLRPPPSDLGKQCAAVSTHCGAMSEPPHTCSPRCWMLACHGHCPTRASRPPTIRLDTWGCPQAEGDKGDSREGRGWGWGGSRLRGGWGQGDAGPRAQAL